MSAVDGEPPRGLTRMGWRLGYEAASRVRGAPPPVGEHSRGAASCAPSERSTTG